MTQDVAAARVDLERLGKLADQATPGPWKFTGVEYADNGGKYFSVISKGWDTIVGECGPAESDAAFIAAANPATIKALLARVAALEEGMSIFRDIERYHGIECVPDNEIIGRIRTFLDSQKGGGA